MKNNEGKNTKMMPAICTQCGGPVEVDAKRSNAICQYCGSQIIVEKPKISAMESVLSFVSDQQKRIDDAKKEKKEEERKAREEADKSFKKYGRIYLLVMFIMFGFLAFMSHEEEKSNKISINNSSSELVGKNYKDVVIKLKENGFVNIKTEAVEDLIIGLFTTDGEVEQVEINGNIDFSSGAKFAEDAEIIVTYHTFPVTK
jgi:DNA-directed RNA polymerase subunit RPC12/RpoP